MNTDLTALCAAYDHFIRLERGLSPTTAKGYRNGIRRFVHRLEENGYPSPTTDTLNPLTLRRYVQHLSGGDRRSRAVHSAMQPVRSLCQWLVSEGCLPEDPAAGLTLPKKGAAVRHVPTDNEVQRLFEACGRLPTVRQCEMARAVPHHRAGSKSRN